MGVLDHEVSFSQAVSGSDNSARLKTLCVEVEYIKQVSNQRGLCPFDKLVSCMFPESQIVKSSEAVATENKRFMMLRFSSLAAVELLYQLICAA